MPSVRFILQKQIPNPSQLLNLAKHICLEEKKLLNGGEICIQFVSDKKIKAINRTFLNHNYSTDVIAFNYPIPPHKLKIETIPFGDIYISVESAAREAKAGGYLLQQELAWLLAHGLLHLGGYEDKTERLQEKMFKRQKSLLEKLAPNLAPPC